MEKKRYDVRNYQWKKTVALTPVEGNLMEQLYQKYGCANLSQFCKAVVHNEIILPLPTDRECTDDPCILNAELTKYKRMVEEIKKIIK